MIVFAHPLTYRLATIALSRRPTVRSLRAAGAPTHVEG